MVKITSLEDIVNKFKFAGKAIATAGVIAGAYAAVGIAALVTTIGNSIGYVIEKIKAKEKIEKTQMLKEAGTGGILGVIGTGIYTFIDVVPNYNFPLKIIKTLVFNRIFLRAYVGFYHGLTYLRDKVGAAKTIAGVFTGKIKKYLKDAYNEEIKPKFRKSMNKLWALFPVEFASINYVSSITARVAIGVGSDTAFRLFQKPGYQTQNYAYARKQY